MGNYINSHIVLIGKKENIESAISKSVDIDDISLFYQNGSIKYDIFLETRSEAPEDWVRKIKHEYNLDAAFILGVDFDDYEVAYYKEIDGTNVDCEQMYNGVDRDDDESYLELDRLDTLLEENFSKYINDYFKE